MFFESSDLWSTPASGEQIEDAVRVTSESEIGEQNPTLLNNRMQEEEAPISYEAPLPSMHAAVSAKPDPAPSHMKFERTEQEFPTEVGTTAQVPIRWQFAAESEA